jgi:hypothetical protein
MTALVFWLCRRPVVIEHIEVYSLMFSYKSPLYLLTSFPVVPAKLDLMAFIDL